MELLRYLTGHAIIDGRGGAKYKPSESALREQIALEFDLSEQMFDVYRFKQRLKDFLLGVSERKVELGEQEAKTAMPVSLRPSLYDCLERNGKAKGDKAHFYPGYPRWLDDVKGFITLLNACHPEVRISVSDAHEERRGIMRQRKGDRCTY